MALMPGEKATTMVCARTVEGGFFGYACVSEIVPFPNLKLHEGTPFHLTPEIVYQLHKLLPFLHNCFLNGIESHNCLCPFIDYRFATMCATEHAPIDLYN